MSIFQIAGLLYLVLYFGLIIGFRSYLLYRQTGINPFSNLGKKGLEGFVEKVLSFCLLLMVVVGLNFVFIEANYHYLNPISYLELEPVAYVGIGLGFLGLIIAFIAQLQMGKSWRLGLNKSEQPLLVSVGMFNYSRNPIYLGILMAYLGFFLLMPNAFSLVFLALSYMAISIKIRLEENYLLNLYPEQYQAYLNRVGRWF